MSIRFELVKAAEIGPYVEGLRALEASIEYPIADGADMFRIDHGPEYHPFFSGLGESYIGVVLDGDRVIGTAAGAMRQVKIRGRSVTAIYAADLKIAREYRGQSVARKFLLWGMRQMPVVERGLSWRYAYAAAMRGAKGDVMKSVRGFHPGKLVTPAATLGVYFVAPEKLAALNVAGSCLPVPYEDACANLSLEPGGPDGMVSTAGRKDLRLRSTGGEPWPLVHLVVSPTYALPSWPAYLKACGEKMLARGLKGPACFALDPRLKDNLGWLSRRGIDPGATCTVYAWDLTFRASKALWLHLATSEI